MKNSQRQLDIYDFIVAYREVHGYSPTLREIADGLRMGHTTIYYHLERMARRGMIRRESFARAVVLLCREPSE